MVDDARFEREETTEFEDGGSGGYGRCAVRATCWLSNFGKESSRFRRRSARLGLLFEISRDEDIEEANNQGRCEDGNRATQMDDSSHEISHPQLHPSLELVALSQKLGDCSNLHLLRCGGDAGH